MAVLAVFDNKQEATALEIDLIQHLPGLINKIWHPINYVPPPPKGRGMYPEIRLQLMEGAVTN
jgi:hypothetical protein